MATALQTPLESGVSSYLVLPLTALSPSPLNPRKHFDQQKLRELADTMGNGTGVIEPLVVRPAKGNDKYEIVAGERRWRAATIAGLEDVPAVVKHIDDARVLEIMVIENDAREDINELEEGDGFKRLMKFGFDIDKLAARIGRSRKYIYDRVKLLDLVDEGKELLLNGRITAGHAIILARLQPAQQQQALKVSRDPFGRDNGPMFEREDTLLSPEEQDAHRAAKKEDRYEGLKVKSVRELQAWVDTHCRFDPAAPVNVELFPSTAAAVKDARKVVPITHAHHVHPDAKDGDKRIYSVVSWQRADKRTCEYSVLGMVVAGAGRGESFQVCVNKDRCTTHWGQEVRARAKKLAARSAPASTSKAADEKASAEKKAAEQRRRQEAETKKREEDREIRQAALRVAIGRVADAATKVERFVMERAIAEIFYGDADNEGFEQHFGLKPRSVGSYSGDGSTKSLEGLKPGDLIRALTWAAVSSSAAGMADAKLEAWFKSMKVDLRACEAEIRVARKPAVQTSAQATSSKKKAPKKR